MTDVFHTTFRRQRNAARRFLRTGLVVGATPLVFLLVVAFPGLVQGQRNPDGTALKNQDIVSLYKAGVSDGAIISLIRRSKTEFELSPGAIVLLRKEGVSNAVIEVMLGIAAGAPRTVPPGIPADSQVPTTYGYYVVEDGKLREVEAVTVKEVVGLQIQLSGGGWAVDGVRGQPSFTLHDAQPTFIVYQQNVNIQAILFSPAAFVVSMRAYEFNGSDTNPQFFSAIFGRNYNDVVPVNLWRRTRVVIPMDVSPVEGKAGMFKLRPRVPLQPGKYLSYLDGALHPIGTIISTRAFNPYFFALFFEVVDELPSPSASFVPPCLRGETAGFSSGPALTALSTPVTLSRSQKIF